ncbi:hypothetical protein [Amycolatopsis sp. cmx-11-12]|uniref:hypothetical protein n=1 Tax=Amycolatopsis sp. cmx-11-12 TaxID=2785795 RepID=UPI0039181111
MAFERRLHDVVRLSARFTEAESVDGRERAVVGLISWLCRRDRLTLVELVAVALSAVDEDRLKELLVEDQDLAVAFVRARLSELEAAADVALPRRLQSDRRHHINSPAADGVETVDETGVDRRLARFRAWFDREYRLSWPKNHGTHDDAA